MSHVVCLAPNTVGAEASSPQTPAADTDFLSVACLLLPVTKQITAQMSPGGSCPSAHLDPEQPVGGGATASIVTHTEAPDVPAETLSVCVRVCSVCV